MFNQHDISRQSAFHSLGETASWAMTKVRLLIILCSTTLVLVSCARDGNSPPQLLSLQDYVLTANQNFQLEITAFDPDQDFIEFNFNLSPPPPTH